MRSICRLIKFRFRSNFNSGSDQTSIPVPIKLQFRFRLNFNSGSDQTSIPVPIKLQFRFRLNFNSGSDQTSIPVPIKLQFRLIYVLMLLKRIMGQEKCALIASTFYRVRQKNLTFLGFDPPDLNFYINPKIFWNMIDDSFAVIVDK